MITTTSLLKKEEEKEEEEEVEKEGEKGERNGRGMVAGGEGDGNRVHLAGLKRRLSSGRMLAEIKINAIRT